MGLCELVTQIKQSTWQRSDINFERDVRDLGKLDIREKNILFMMCGFFLTIDSVVIDSFNNSLLKDLKILSVHNSQFKKALEFIQNRIDRKRFMINSTRTW
ncbi:21048_t:CDS:1, partial [Racocetra persica]